MPNFDDAAACGLSQQEWSELTTFGTLTLARLLGCTQRYASDHAEDFGGVYVGRRWVFNRWAVARALGIDDGSKVVDA